ncbi:F-box protein At3g07870 [Linum grandiflorum]
MEEEELKKRMELSMEELDSNLLMEILSRLSLKDLSHCRLVCNPWLKLIGNPEFVKLHRSTSLATGILMRSEYDSYCARGMRRHQLAMVEEQDGTGFQVVERMSFSRRVNFPNVDFNIVGCCHGLICLSEEEEDEDDYGEEIEWDYVYVCNPILRQYVTIPVCKSMKFKHTTSFSFGFCASTNQYKLVQTYEPIEEDRGDDDNVPAAEVYTLGTGQWRRIGDALASVEYASLSFDTFLHSSLHWIGSSEGRISDSLFCFDFEKEEFRELPSPSQLANDSSSSLKLGVLNGCLFAAFSRTDDPGKLQIWVMKDYGKDSWMKHLVIGNLDAGRKYLSPLVFSNKGKKVLIKCEESQVVCYDVETGNAEETPMFQTRARRCYPYSFTPCFFSLEDLAGKERFKKLLRQVKRKTAS